MAEFHCRYASNNGEVLTGTFNSSSEADLRHRLNEQGYYVYSIAEKGGILALGLGVQSRPKKIKNTDFIIYNQQFGFSAQLHPPVRAARRAAARRAGLGGCLPAGDYRQWPVETQPAAGLSPPLPQDRQHPGRAGGN